MKIMIVDPQTLQDEEEIVNWTGRKCIILKIQFPLKSKLHCLAFSLAGGGGGLLTPFFSSMLTLEI